MILSAVFSKPAVSSLSAFGRTFTDCTKVRFAYNSRTAQYDVTIYTKTQCMTLHVPQADCDTFLAQHAGTTFKAVTSRTESEETVTLANRHGTVRTLHHALKAQTAPLHTALSGAHDRKKQYLLQPDTPLPFLVRLGVQTQDGKLVAEKHAKFRQINRFLEYIDDVLPFLTDSAGGTFTQERPLRITDFGCGKSYLTFAVYWFLHEKRGIPVRIQGLDLKADVISRCTSLAEECRFDGLTFSTGSIEDFTYTEPPDLIVTLHACDTATDAALEHAVAAGTPALLSVPCCQHEINSQLEKTRKEAAAESPFASLLQYGILRERFAALATDALRAEYLVQNGYAVQLLEFIDEELTPKNILIRATKKRLTNGKAQADAQKAAGQSAARAQALLGSLGVTQALTRQDQSPFPH